MAMDSGKPGGKGSRKAVSLWDIERLLLGELRGEEADAVRRTIEASPELKTYLKRMEHEAPRRTLEDLRRLRADRLAVGTRAGEPPGRSAGARERGTLPFRMPAFWRPAMALCVVLLAGAVVWRFQGDGLDSDGIPAYRGKGGDSLEIRLRVGGRTVLPGDTAAAQNGDTLEFLYRSPRPVNVLVFYQEDDADPVSVGDGKVASQAWPVATRWTPVAERMLLEGDWTRQAIWIVVGDTAGAAEAVAAAAKGGRGPADTRVRVFHLKAAGP